ncbi:MAG: hypothetical protein H0X13_02740 [Ramlibacter sp.]|nr:hypothetical protein [Ramlibacter sp.]
MAPLQALYLRCLDYKSTGFHLRLQLQKLIQPTKAWQLDNYYFTGKARSPQENKSQGWSEQADFDHVPGSAYDEDHQG